MTGRKEERGEEKINGGEEEKAAERRMEIFERDKMERETGRG